MRSNDLTLCVVLMLAAAGCSSSPEKTEEKEGAVTPVVAVKVAQAVKGDVDLQVSATATVFPREQVSIAARITAPIRELRVKKGAHVAQGQVLALLEDRDLQAQRAEAVAAVTDAQESQRKVSAGTLPADIDRARGQVATSQSAFDLAQKNYDRRKQLYGLGAIPERDLNVSEAELAQTRTNLDVAKRALDLLQNQSGEQDVRIAQSRVVQAQARLATIDAQLGYTQLLSPLSGTVTDQMAYAGDMAKPDSPMLTIMDLTTVVARAQVPEGDASQIRSGESCRFESSDAPGVSAAGSITVVNRTVDPARRTVEIWCELTSPPAWVRAGSFGPVSIVTGRAPGSVLVPREAVQFEEGTRRGVVMVVDDQHKAHETKVECGAIVGGRVQILKGLKAGDQVITEGGFGLPDGTQVTAAAEKAEEKPDGPAEGKADSKASDEKSAEKAK